MSLHPVFSYVFQSCVLHSTTEYNLLICSHAIHPRRRGKKEQSNAAVNANIFRLHQFNQHMTCVSMSLPPSPALEVTPNADRQQMGLHYQLRGADHGGLTSSSKSGSQKLNIPNAVVEINLKMS